MFRNVNDSFWDDSKVVDEFTPEDKYFFLYLLTNPCLKMIGCFEISNKRIALDMGYDVDTIKKLIVRFATVHKVITYDENTKEILINNYDMNWNGGEKVDSALQKQIAEVGSPVLKNILIEKYNQRTDKDGEFIEPLETVEVPEDYRLWIGDTYPIDSLSIGFTISKSNTKPKSKSNSNSKANTKSKTVVEEVISYFDNPELDEAFRQFIEHRKQIKKPMTELSLKQNVKKLMDIAESDEERIEIIQNSIAGGWQGLFPISNRGRPKGKTRKLTDEEWRDL